MSLLEKIRDEFEPKGCIVKRLKKDGCKVGMTGVPKDKVVIDFDKPGSPLSENEKRCDYFVFVEERNPLDWVMVLELKRGKLHANEVVKQLQASASVAEKIVPSSHKIQFRPIAVSRGISRRERNHLKNKSITFHKHSEAVRLMSCGTPLAEVLKD